MSLQAVNMPKYATVRNSGVARLGTGASTVGATAIGVDGIAADAKAVYTAGAYGGIVQSVLLSTDDTAAVNAFLYILDEATVIPIGIVNVPVNSGNAASTPNIDALTNIAGLPKDDAGVKYLPLKANQILKVASFAAMTANKSLWASALGVDFVA